jgi:hypothetical protein
MFAKSKRRMTMKYNKPQLALIGRAITAVQGQQKMSSHADALPPINPPSNATTGAYESDE